MFIQRMTPKKTKQNYSKSGRNLWMCGACGREPAPGGAHGSPQNGAAPHHRAARALQLSPAADPSPLSPILGFPRPGICLKIHKSLKKLPEFALTCACFFLKQNKRSEGRTPVGAASPFYEISHIHIAAAFMSKPPMQ